MTGGSNRSALAFVLRAAAWIAVLFGTLRLDWVQEHLLIPWAGLQQDLACALTGAPREGLVVDQSCSGSDAMALCIGAILAFPVSWKRRLAGAALGLGLVLAVNTIRIAHLSYLVSNRELFRLFHLNVWPAAIILVAAVYVFWWMRRADDPQPAAGRSGLLRAEGLGRFVAVAGLLLTVYYVLSRWWLESDVLQRTALAVAGTAGALMRVLGLPATVDDAVLRTPGGIWLVTPDCVTTPLIPIYLAAVLTWKLTPVRRLAALLAVVPLFFGLATARLLVLALPAAIVGSPEIAVHAFYQVLLAAVLVAVVARRRSREGWTGRAATAFGIGAAAAIPCGLVDLRWLRAELLPRLESLHLGHSWVDSQGTLALLPAFQIGLLLALWWAAGRPGGHRMAAARLALVILGAAATVIAAGEAATHLGFELPVVLLRAWTLLLPTALLADLLIRSAPRGAEAPRRAAPTPAA